jgi:hypothetical protein
MLPQGLDLVYWDYYHTDSTQYERMISKHAAAVTDKSNSRNNSSVSDSDAREPSQHRVALTQQGRQLLVATGGWTWSRFWAALPWAFETTGAAMAAAKRQHVRQAYTTLWMDDGAEVRVYSLWLSNRPRIGDRACTLLRAQQPSSLVRASGPSFGWALFALVSTSEAHRNKRRTVK